MGILYRYELKKIMSQKVIWIALLIMTAMIVAQGMSGLMTGNNKLLKKADAISGRAVNQELITELLEGNQLDNYPVMKNLWTQCIHKNDYTGLDEQTLYGSRLAVIDQEMDSYKLSDSEKEYWSRQDEKVQKPFIYQREDGYSALFSTIYILNFLMLLLVGISVTGVFADEKSRGTDQLIFSSVNKRKIFGAKMLAAITVGAGVAVFFFGLTFLLGIGIYGAAGFHAQIQISIPCCMLSITVGQAVLMMFGLLIMAGILYAVLSAFLSQVLGNHSVAMGVMVLVMLLSMLNIPENFRVISQIWRYMPGAFIGSWTFTDYRLTKVFGHYLNIFQMAPVAWMLAAVVVFLIAKMSYDRYQVKGR